MSGLGRPIRSSEDLNAGRATRTVAGFKSLGGGGVMTADAVMAKVFERGLKSVAAAAYKEHGLAAFECSKRAAAAHEAGHRIAYATFGEPVLKVVIRACGNNGALSWIGMTHAACAWATSPDTDPNDDFVHAILTIAGLAAEDLFDPPRRVGSSLDERAAFTILIAHVANKTGLSLGEVLHPAMYVTIELLRHNAAVHRALADKLFFHKTLRGKQLAPFLARVLAQDRRTMFARATAAIAALAAASTTVAP